VPSRAISSACDYDRGEQTALAGSSLARSVEYGADVLPGDLNCAGSYDTGGSDASDGEICYASPPAHARRVWFDFCNTTDGDHPVCRLTIDLATGQIQVERAVAGEGSH
jgi:hypothetical protein